MGNTHEFHRLGHFGQNCFFRPLQLQRSKRDLVKDRGVEELHIRILEDQRDPAAKGQGVVIALEEFGGQPLAVEAYRAFGCEVQGIENAQQGRFSRSVCAQQCDAFALRDLQRQSAQRGNAIVLEARVL